MLKAPVRIRINVKNKVDNPIINATVPAIDMRNFQTFMTLHR
jgi:hypothetical protein